MRRIENGGIPDLRGLAQPFASAFRAAANKTRCSAFGATALSIPATVQANTQHNIILAPSACVIALAPDYLHIEDSQHR